MLQCNFVASELMMTLYGEREGEITSEVTGGFIQQTKNTESSYIITETDTGAGGTYVRSPWCWFILASDWYQE